MELPTGKTAAELSQYVYIDVYDPMGRGDWSNPDSDGNFEIPLQPGEYELSIWVDPLLTGYGSPTGQIVRVGKTSVNVGELQLATFDSNITGTLTTDSGSYLHNVEVWAWSEEGGWSSAFTNAKGEYTLNVAPGRWEVGYEIPVADDGSDFNFLIRVLQLEGDRFLFKRSHPPRKVDSHGISTTFRQIKGEEALVIGMTERFIEHGIRLIEPIVEIGLTISIVVLVNPNVRIS